ncbi:MAG: hypothetical protein HC904_14160 [Blastochloris sp.]|nr:hypothetical protein [Blastochloris sp.]
MANPAPPPSEDPPTMTGAMEAGLALAPIAGAAEAAGLGMAAGATAPGFPAAEGIGAIPLAGLPMGIGAGPFGVAATGAVPARAEGVFGTPAGDNAGLGAEGFGAIGVSGAVEGAAITLVLDLISSELDCKAAAGAGKGAFGTPGTGGLEASGMAGATGIGGLAGAGATGAGIPIGLGRDGVGGATGAAAGLVGSAPGLA